MGRGGGKVAGAKSSVAKTGGSSSSTSVTVSGPVDPKLLGVGFAILGVVFFICTIAVPISMVANPAGTPCSNTDSLNRNEQGICVPDSEQVGEDILVEYDRSADGYMKAFRGKKSDLVNNNVTRVYSWLHYNCRLQGSYDYFSFSVPIGVVGYLNVICDTSAKKEKCKKVKMYLLTQSEFDEAIDENGEFHEKTNKKDAKGFDESDNEYYFWATGKGQYYLVFSLKDEKNKPTNIYYDIVLKYQLYDTTNMEEVECKKGECEIENIKEDEIVIADFVVPKDADCKEREEFPNLGLFCYDYCTNPKEYVCGGTVHGSQPEYTDLKIHDLDINWSGVAAAAVIFALLTLVCFALAALYLYKVLKKIGKLGKKVAKKLDKMEEKNSTQMDAVPAQPVQADPTYATPYPGQPVADPAYAAAPYPGQPM